MKKEYTNPIIEIIKLNDEDIIITSGSLGSYHAGDEGTDYSNLG